MIIVVTIVLVIIAVIALYLLSRKISIDIRSFIEKTMKLDRGKFGVYCFTGKQGSGKTYSLVKYISKHVGKNQKIYSNISMTGVEYEVITSVEHLLSLKDKKNCFIVYDEIFTLMSKQTRLNDEVMEFLTQQRKMKNIFMTTAQEWLEIPITFRRFVRIQIDCRTIPLGKLGGILIETYADGYQIKWDQLENEYVAPVISKKISKYERRFMESYDTFERIRRLNDAHVVSGSAAARRTR